MAKVGRESREVWNGSESIDSGSVATGPWFLHARLGFVLHGEWILWYPCLTHLDFTYRLLCRVSAKLFSYYIEPYWDDQWLLVIVLKTILVDSLTTEQKIPIELISAVFYRHSTFKERSFYISSKILCIIDSDITRCPRWGRFFNNVHNIKWKHAHTCVLTLKY